MAKVKWTDDEENQLIKELKENMNIYECSTKHNRTEIAIKSRVELIIYKKIIKEDENMEDIDFLKKYVDISIEDIIRKNKNKKRLPKYK